MLKLNQIIKDYVSGDETVEALKGVSIEFRKSEFVSILGQSGCGKTTLLNIIGGLDQYTSGDLIINGKSTKKFKDRDWDSYRNHSVGFVFQSYNLIPHQSVLSNVELALTLSGVSKAERRKRAIDALEQVGLGDQIHKKPNQMSGGQMQRVAIARAIVNDPEILLADEPTGALDSQTSVQVMEILKEISKDRLIIMVTHNPELADKYSTRIIRLLDGEVTDDSNPYVTDETPIVDEKEKRKERKKKEKKDKKKNKTSMSFFTALSLSLNNLMTKKGRTLMTSFAGSIGIIGIALIMSVSSGVQNYITSVEEDTMSSYPITIDETTMDTNSLISSLMNDNKNTKYQKSNRIYSNDVMTEMMTNMTTGITKNNLTDLKDYFESDKCDIDKYTNDVKYSYSTELNTYLEKDDGTYSKGLRNYSELFEEIGMSSTAVGMSSMYSSTSATWQELVGNEKYIDSQYDLLYGSYPKKDNDVVIIVDENNQISDYTLYALGIRDTEELKNYLKESQKAIENGKEYNKKFKSTNYSFKELCSYKFKVLLASDYYDYNSKSNLITECNTVKINNKLKDAQEVNIVGIIKPSSDSAISSENIGMIGYKGSLMTDLIDKANSSAVVKAQKNNKKTDLFSGLPFESGEFTAEQVRAYMSQNSEYADYMNLPDETLLQYASEIMKTTATYEDNLSKLGYVNFKCPTQISIYPKDFDSKDEVVSIIENYNKKQTKDDKITYTDTVGLLMSSVTTIINAISYVLIAFVAISLIVSSIMIGIITYISVLERTKEIGILRAIGASKKDISRVFNAETLSVGFVAGALGIVVTLLLLIPINLILHSVTGIDNLSASLPYVGAIVLVLISMFLTFIAGLIPSKVASKKDPVVALRSE